MPYDKELTLADLKPGSIVVLKQLHPASWTADARLDVKNRVQFKFVASVTEVLGDFQPLTPSAMCGMNEARLWLRHLELVNKPLETIEDLEELYAI